MFEWLGQIMAFIKNVDDLKKLLFSTILEFCEYSIGSMLDVGLDLKKCIVTETSSSTGCQ